MLIGLGAISACDREIIFYQGDPVAALEEGRWDWKYAEGFCETSPHSFKFDLPSQRLTIRWHQGKTDEIDDETLYTINEMDGAVFHTDMIGEDRRDDAGNLVSWDLIVNSPNEYCWRRSDWRATRCTDPWLKCSR